jgi:hypothetical protein
MRKSKFTESQIVGILGEGELANYVSDQSCPASAATSTHISNECSMKRVWLNMNYSVW